MFSDCKRVGTNVLSSEARKYFDKIGAKPEDVREDQSIYRFGESKTGVIVFEDGNKPIQLWSDVYYFNESILRLVAGYEAELELTPIPAWPPV